MLSCLKRKNNGYKKVSNKSSRNNDFRREMFIKSPTMDYVDFELNSSISKMQRKDSKRCKEILKHWIKFFKEYTSRKGPQITNLSFSYKDLKKQQITEEYPITDFILQYDIYAIKVQRRLIQKTEQKKYINDNAEIADINNDNKNKDPPAMTDIFEDEDDLRRKFRKDHRYNVSLPLSAENLSLNRTQHQIEEGNNATSTIHQAKRAGSSPLIALPREAFNKSPNFKSKHKSPKNPSTDSSTFSLSALNSSSIKSNISGLLLWPKETTPKNSIPENTVFSEVTDFGVNTKELIARKDFHLQLHKSKSLHHSSSKLKFRKPNYRSGERGSPTTISKPKNIDLDYEQSFTNIRPAPATPTKVKQYTEISKIQTSQFPIAPNIQPSLLEKQPSYESDILKTPPRTIKNMEVHKTANVLPNEFNSKNESQEHYETNTKVDKTLQHPFPKDNKSFFLEKYALLSTNDDNLTDSSGQSRYETPKSVLTNESLSNILEKRDFNEKIYVEHNDANAEGNVVSDLPNFDIHASLPDTPNLKTHQYNDMPKRNPNLLKYNIHQFAENRRVGGLDNTVDYEFYSQDWEQENSTREDDKEQVVFFDLPKKRPSLFKRKSSLVDDLLRKKKGSQ